MGKYIIQGGNKLQGEIGIGGAKNSVLPIIAGSILNKKTCTIHNCPKISDTYLSIEILKHLGCKVIFEGNTLFIDSTNIRTTSIPEEFVTPMRSSIIFLGSLLGREHECTIGYPGGCELGKRPIDLHLLGLKALGANLTESEEGIHATLTSLVGNTVNLTFPSVGATENIMLAAVLASGETIINNPAKEPEIVDLQNFLNTMGAKITGAGTNKIIIRGVSTLHDLEYTVSCDRIVTGTYIFGTIMTKGEVFFTNVGEREISTYKKEILRTGATIKFKDNGILVKSPEVIKNIPWVSTEPHPGFPTDMQSQLVAMLSIANGKSVVNENIFESRTKHIEELNKMGADINISFDNRTFDITGVPELFGTTVEAKDLRGGASLVLAGLVANGVTIVNNSEYVQRGYENISIDLNLLGANIKYLDVFNQNKTA